MSPLIDHAAIIAAAKFRIGQRVNKCTGYFGPGEVRGVFTMSDGKLMYNVEHRILGGGLFVHNYIEKNLEEAIWPRTGIIG